MINVIREWGGYHSHGAVPGCSQGYDETLMAFRSPLLGHQAGLHIGIIGLAARGAPHAYIKNLTGAVAVLKTDLRIVQSKQIVEWPIIQCSKSVGNNELSLAFCRQFNGLQVDNFAALECRVDRLGNTRSLKRF